MIIKITSTILLLLTFPFHRIFFHYNPDISYVVRDVSFYAILAVCGFSYNFSKESMSKVKMNFIQLNIIGLVTFLIGTISSEWYLYDYLQGFPSMIKLEFWLADFLLCAMFINLGFLLCFLSNKVILKRKYKH